MSDETAKQLEKARADEARQRAVADGVKRECLESVARSIQVRVDEIAKQIAQSQPEVTKALGVDGIKAFRAELAERAAVIASDVEAASEQIEWPQKVGARSQDVHSALFNLLYGKRMDSLAEIPKRHGFSMGDGGSLKYPQSLYDRDGFADLAEVLGSLAQATRAADAAKAADDLDIVDSMWDEADISLATKATVTSATAGQAPEPSSHPRRA